MSEIKFITDFKSDLKSLVWNPNKPIVITEKNIKITERGYIQIVKMINGLYIRVSTKLKANNENLELIKSEAVTYLLKEIQNQGYIIPSIESKRCPDEYLHESFLYFLQDLELQVKESTYAKHKVFMESLKKIFLHKRTNGIDKYFLHNYAIKLHKQGYSKNDIKYKINTIIRVANHYRNAFNLPALDKQGINLKVLGAEAREKRALTEREINAILNHVKDDREFYNYLMIASHTGARVGEILALTKKDINTELKYINIDKAKNMQGKVTKPKTKSSIRNIPFINANFSNFIESIAKEAKNEIFTSLTRPQIQAKWKKALNNLKIEACPIYRLRHTFATLTIAKSNNILAVSQILGHSNANITLNAYAINKNIHLQEVDFSFTKGEEVMVK